MPATEWELRNLKGIVYIIKNKVNWKRYIGRTKDAFRRRYKKDLIKYASNQYFVNALNKYGETNFEIEILMSGLSELAQKYWEKFYIRYFQTQDSRYGYNIKDGGEDCGKMSDDARLRLSLSQLSTVDEFVAKARKIHGDKYDYSKVEIVPFNQKVKIGCVKHNEFFIQARGNHLMGQGCKKCALANRPQSKFLTKEEFLRKAIDKFGNQFEYDLDNYNGGNFKIKMKHKNCGYEFYQNAHLHIGIRKIACPKCAYRICNKSRFRKVVQIDIVTGVILDVFESIAEAGNYIDVDFRGIWRSCNSHYFFAGFKWLYFEDAFFC